MKKFEYFFILAVFSIIFIVPATSHLQDLNQNKSADSLSANPSHSGIRSLRIDEIVIAGNKKTKDVVILREMILKVDSLATAEAMERDEKRIQNTFLFNRVQLKLERRNNKNMLEVSVTEHLYVYPFPMLMISDNDWKKISYGGGFVNTNFRGMGEVIGASAWSGYNPGFIIFYSNPWIGSGDKISLDARTKIYRAKNRSTSLPEFYEQRREINLQLSRRFGLYLTVTGGLALSTLSSDPYIPGATISANNKDLLMELSGAVSYNNLDLYEFPHKGYFTRIYLRKIGFPGMEVNYTRLRYSIRKYFPMTSRSTVTAMYLSEFSFGRKIPVYDLIYLGYYDRIRGHFNEVYEGENKMMAGIAYRFKLRKISYYTWKGAPKIFGSNFENMKFGISTGVFANSGIIWRNSQSINSGTLLNGFGFSVYFHVPFINLLRLDIAFNGRMKGEFILDTFLPF